MKRFLSQLIEILVQPLVPAWQKEAPLSQEVIGTAHFDNQHYFFVRDGDKVFLVSDTDTYVYRQNVCFSRIMTRHIPNMCDLDAVTLPNGEHAMVCTVKLKRGYKTVYLTSQDTRHFKAWSMVRNPNGHATKIIVHAANQIALVTSINGEICYRDLDVHNRNVEYHTTPLVPRHDSFDHSPLRVVGVFDLPDGVFVLYDTSYEMRGFVTHRFGAALLAHGNLGHCHWRAYFDEVPFWDYFVSKKENEHLSLSAISAYHRGDTIHVYFYDCLNRDMYTLDLHEPYSRRDPHPDKAILRKYVHNPILKPNEDHAWECYATFNPTALQIGNTTHLLYRAEGSAGLSVIGYGSSYNGVTFDRLPDPIYVPTMDFEGVNLSPDMIRLLRKRSTSFKSGYNHYPTDYHGYRWHGVEDPRMTEMEGRIYMIYSAYNGYQMARPAITSIDTNDFLNHRWNWAVPQVMTEQAYAWGQGNKNVVLHPEKVNGKYVIFHRIWPHIRIDYVDNLEFGPGKKYLKELARIEARGDSWDSNRVGVSSAPILIDEGWLMIYQGSGSQDRRYKVGAMILDRYDPSKVLYRSGQPILAPTEWYENDNKSGVAYPCGAVVRDGTLYVYYGASDKYVSVATAPLREFIDKLKHDAYQKPELTKRIGIDDLCI